VENLLLAAHVVAGILFVGPIAVATSLFPRFGSTRSDPMPGPIPAISSAPSAGEGGVSVARFLHRTTRVYALLALAVPAFGLVLAAVQGRLTEIWVVAAMVLTAVAGAILALRIVPAQRDALMAPGRADLKGLRILTGVFNLVWVVVVVLMIVRPGAR